MFAERAAQLLTIATLTATTAVANPVIAKEPQQTRPEASSTRTVDSAQVQRLKRVFIPLVNAMDHPRPLGQIKVGIADDSHINAASGGNGEFYVTTGLLGLLSARLRAPL